MSGTPFVSVVIPVYNVEEYLADCLDSVMNQTYHNYEVILVDDGSTDRSGEICDLYEKSHSNVKVIHQSNKGLSDARNAGIKIAQCDYIVFVDSDDYVSRSYLHNLVAIVMDSDSDIGVTKLVETRGAITPTIQNDAHIKLIQYSPTQAIEDLLYQRHIPPAAFAKIYAFNLFDGICYPSGLLYEDLPTTYKLFKKSRRIIYASYEDYYYRIRSNSIQNMEYSPRKMDLFKSLDVIGSDIQDERLVNPFNSRLFSSSFNILMQIPKNEYNSAAHYLWGNIKKYRCSILKDAKAPSRSKLAAIISFSGFRLTRYIYTLYKSNKINNLR